MSKGQFAPPIQRGVHLTVEDNHFKIAVTIKNISDESVTLRTMDSSLFHPSMKERTFTEEGTVHRWSPNHMSMQAVTMWELPPDGIETRHYDVPNESMARERAQEYVDEFDYWDSVDDLMRGPFAHVEPAEAGVVRVESSFPAIEGYHDSLTRQFDLRGERWESSLDLELPAKSADAETLM